MCLPQKCLSKVNKIRKQDVACSCSGFSCLKHHDACQLCVELLTSLKLAVSRERNAK